MIHVIARITVKPGKLDEFMAIFKANVPAVLAEAGCIAYTPCLDVATGFHQTDPNAVTIVERWESLDHLKAHLAAPHMKRYADAVRDLRTGLELTVVEPA